MSSGAQRQDSYFRIASTEGNAGVRHTQAVPSSMVNFTQTSSLGRDCFFLSQKEHSTMAFSVFGVSSLATNQTPVDRKRTLQALGQILPGL